MKWLILNINRFILIIGEVSPNLRYSKSCCYKVFQVSNIKLRNYTVNNIFSCVFLVTIFDLQSNKENLS